MPSFVNFPSSVQHQDDTVHEHHVLDWNCGGRRLLLLGSPMPLPWHAGLQFGNKQCESATVRWCSATCDMSARRVNVLCHCCEVGGSAQGEPPAGTFSSAILVANIMLGQPSSKDTFGLHIFERTSFSHQSCFNCAAAVFPFFDLKPLMQISQSFLPKNVSLCCLPCLHRLWPKLVMPLQQTLIAAEPDQSYVTRSTPPAVTRTLSALSTSSCCATRVCTVSSCNWHDVMVCLLL